MDIRTTGGVYILTTNQSAESYELDGRSAMNVLRNLVWEFRGKNPLGTLFQAWIWKKDDNTLVVNYEEDNHGQWRVLEGPDDLRTFFGD